MKMNKKMIKRIAVILGVVILPLLYSYFYLGAFWDPYSKLETLPVAVVNEDTGATINDEERNVGQELVDSLLEDGSLGFTVTDKEDAESGTEDGTYYAMIVIPSDFSADVASASTTDKETATIEYSPNQKTNYLASQILNKAVLQIEVSVREKVNKEIVTQLADKLNSIPDQMTELEDGLTELNDGATKLSDGANTLSDGTEEFSTKFDEYQDGVTTLQDGAATLNTGMTTLDSGISTLLAGADKLVTSTEDLDKLTTGAKSLAEGAAAFNDSLTQYTAGVSALIASVNDTTTFLTYYVTTVNPSIMADPVFAAFIQQMSASASSGSIDTLTAATTQIQAASEQIAAATAQIAAGTTDLPTLKAALVQLQAGITSAKEGSAKLATGSASLAAGTDKVADATTQLGDAADQIADGASDLSDGADQLTDGVSTAKDAVSDSVTDSNGEISALDGLADYASTPVTVEETDTVTVPNYGTAFAPYFLSLSLWVGGLMIFVGIYYDPDNKFKILSRETSNKVARSLIYLLIGVAQAVLLGVVLIFALGLKVDNLPLYFLSTTLVSVVFIAIIQFLMVFLKDLGKFISMLLLILQLTSCGGTFPMETVPGFFNALYKYMPMTYSVDLFKQSISGVRTSSLLKDVAILGGLLIVFMALTIICSLFRSKNSNTSTISQIEAFE